MSRPREEEVRFPEALQNRRHGAASRSCRPDRNSVDVCGPWHPLMALRIARKFPQSSSLSVTAAEADVTRAEEARDSGTASNSRVRLLSGPGVWTQTWENVGQWL